MKLPAIGDDQLLHPPADEQIAIGDIAEISGMKPAVAHRFRRRRRVVEVAVHDRWPGERDFTDFTSDRLAPRRLHDAQLMAREGGSAADQAIADSRRAIASRQRGREHVFRESVAGKKTGRPEPGTSEACGERSQRRRMNRFGAASRNPPARKIQSFEIAIFQTAHHQVVGKIRCEADRRAIARNGFQPVQRPLDEQLRWQQDRGSRGVQRPERHTDQPHVVMERQPADRRVVGRCSKTGGAVDRVDVRRNVGMRQRHAFRR